MATMDPSSPGGVTVNGTNACSCASDSTTNGCSPSRWDSEQMFASRGRLCYGSPNIRSTPLGDHTMTEHRLTDRQREVLEVIDQSMRDRGYPPSVREIGEAVGLTSPSTVHSH